MYAVTVAAQHMLLAVDENNAAAVALHTFAAHRLLDLAEIHLCCSTLNSERHYRMF